MTTITGAKPGPVLFVDAGGHGGEYPAVETVIRLDTALNAAEIAGTVVLMPVLNLPAFWQRNSFVCPVNNVNPNRVFPGEPHGTYSEQMAHALLNEFIVHADAYLAWELIVLCDLAWWWYRSRATFPGRLEESSATPSSLGALRSWHVARSHI